MAYILHHTEDGPRHVPIFIDPKTGRPDPTRGEDGKPLKNSDRPEKYRDDSVQADDSEKPLSKLTVDELKAHAEENGIDLGEATKKADIIAAIEGASSE